MVSAGEYIIKSNSVKNIGVNNLDRLNNKYAEGGLVTRQQINTADNSSAILGNLLVAINNLNNSISGGDKPSANGTNVNNYIDVKVTIDGQGNVTSESSSTTKSDKKDNNTGNEKNLAALEKQIKSMTQKYVIEMTKANGPLRNFVDDRISKS